MDGEIEMEIQKLFLAITILGFMCTQKAHASLDHKHAAELSLTSSAAGADTALASSAFRVQKAGIGVVSIRRQEQRGLVHPAIQRRAMCRCAARNGDAQTLISITPKQDNHSDEKALKDYFFIIQNLTMQEYITYQNALALIERNRLQAAQDIQQAVHEHINAPKVTMLVAQMLHPTIGYKNREKSIVVASVMHPELEAAIVAGDNQKFDKLAAGGWLMDTSNREGLDALSLAVHHGHPEIVKKIIGQIPFVAEQRRNELKKFAEAQAKRYQELGDSQTQEKGKKYTEIAEFIDTDWPKLTQEQNARLSSAIAFAQTDQAMQALAKGANPSGQLHDNDQTIVSYALYKSSIFLKMLIDAKLDLKIEINNARYGSSQSILSYAIDGRSPRMDIIKLLLDAGCDPNERELAHGVPIVFSILIDRQDPSLLQMCLDTKKINLHAKIQDKKGYLYTLLVLAIYMDLPDHAKLLLNAGCDSNELDSLNNPIAVHALTRDNVIFLKMLIAYGANMHATIHLDTGKTLSLVDYAKTLNKPEHLKIIEDAIAEQEYIYSCA